MAKSSYEAAKNKSLKTNTEWNKKHFKFTPWGISYLLSRASHIKSKAKDDVIDEKIATALRYLVIAVILDWEELISNLKRTLINWNISSEELQAIANQVWRDSTTLNDIIKTVVDAQKNPIKLIEAVEKHETLNPKLFTKEEVLKERVRVKMLEIVDEFLENLKEQDIKIKVKDVILVGSNASYNYTKDSDLDLHLIADIKAVKYTDEVANALYSAYRTLFNKQLDINIFDIPLEIFVEGTDSSRVSNGIYSVKKDKWLKKPVHEDIPDYDKKALNKLVKIWEAKCKKLIKSIEADKEEDEKKVVKLIEDIYEELRKKGIAKGEYAVENLAFKELRNNGYLDKLKEYRNELTSKRLSLEERLSKRSQIEAYNQLAQIAGTQPIIQENGLFYIYNLKESEISSKVTALKKLPIVKEVYAQESSKYDFSDVNKILRSNVPAKYYNIRGYLNNLE
jgi:hypothetical protein